MTGNLNISKSDNYVSSEKVKKPKHELVIGLIIVTFAALLISIFKPERNYNFDPSMEELCSSAKTAASVTDNIKCGSYYGVKVISKAILP